MARKTKTSKTQTSSEVKKTSKDVKKSAKETQRSEMDQLLDSLRGHVSTIQTMLTVACSNPEVSLSTIAKVSKITADILDRVYKIQHGKAAQEEMMVMIGELQRHLLQVENKNAEKERRSRSKPLLQIIGELPTEDEIKPDEDDDYKEENYRPRDIQAQVDIETQVSGRL